MVSDAQPAHRHATVIYAIIFEMGTLGTPHALNAETPSAQPSLTGLAMTKSIGQLNVSRLKKEEVTPA